MSQNRLEKHREKIGECIRCGKCNATCPTLTQTNDESIGPRGRIAIISAMLNGNISASDKGVVKKISTCLSCMSCNETCPNFINPAEVIMAARQEIAAEDSSGKKLTLGRNFILKRMGRILCLSKISSYLTRLYNLIPANGFWGKFLPYSDEKGKRLIPMSKKKDFLSEYPNIIPSEQKGEKVTYFLGCTTNLLFQSEGEALISLLKKMGVEILIPNEQTCCGAPAYHIGDIEGTRELAEKNIAVLTKETPDIVITSCATCGHMLKEIYPEIAKGEIFKEAAGEFGKKVLDINRFIVERINKLDINKGKSSGEKGKVTYHDPCHLRRGLGIFEEPRMILKSINRIEYIEMENADTCCGGSGLFSVKHYDLAKKIGKVKVENIVKSGADIVATSCPSCKMQLEDMLRREGSKVKVYHTIELLNKFLE